MGLIRTSGNRVKQISVNVIPLFKMAALLANRVAEELNSGLQKTLRNDSWTRLPNFMFHSKAHILKPKDYDVLTGNCRLQNTDSRLHIPHCILQIAD